MGLLISGILLSQNIYNVKIKNYKIADLSDEIKETSGLTLVNNELYTINDSGNEPILYTLNKKTGLVEKRFKMPFQNVDWEIVSSDSEGNLYIGDVGNNSGKRKDLTIYKLAEDKVNAEAFSLKYKDQPTEPLHQNHDYDLEAMIVQNKTAHLFSKSWNTGQMRHYTLILEKGNSPYPVLVETIKLPYVVTDATQFKNLVWMVGYSRGANVYLTHYSLEQGKLINPTTWFIGMSTGIGQVEGVAANEDGLYISAEKFKKTPFKVDAALYFVPYNKLNKDGITQKSN